VETPIYQTNYLFRGVVVPAGRHTVVFAYRPTSVLVGATISLVTLVLSAGLLIVGRRYDHGLRPILLDSPAGLTPSR
jgi:uncharacterized membrane protein YfhO